ncbi:MAG: tRNA (N(6)-L-threonylcarbamoyladenosine(37)-C(2))-methylthiotransferase MtaB [Candidatus Omnitrophica bacterium]|nr:tRNA (N(6)-L-threonylcarbamoyladenosine(37)-C(2))-methylthiotransferase MtaB [Candidatus Omnitrophota bacterium]
MKVKFFTLGCKVNQYETQGLKEKLFEFGFSETDKKADLYVINTCTVTHRADSKSRQAIKQAKKENPLAKIAVCGCLPQLNRAVIEKIGADYIVSQGDKHLLPEIISGDLSGQKLKTDSNDIWSLKITHFNNQRAFVKIQDGCSNFCSFCKIPHLRGPSRSRAKNQVIAECLRISKLHKEIVLCGVNLSLWGRDFNPATSLADLVEEILTIPSLGRLRLSSLESKFIDEKLISLFNNRKLCSHVHLPFQYGDDRILTEMNKKETVALYEDKVFQLRAIKPQIGLSCDIIVGFPGEDQERFENTVAFLKRLEPMRMHIFSFSPREGTKFSKLSLTNQKETKLRFDALRKLADQFSFKYAQKFLGEELEVVIEEKSRGFACGYTENYIKVYIKDEVSLGDIIRVRIEEIKNNKVFAHAS